MWANSPNAEPCCVSLSQEILTRDSVTVKVDAVVYYKIHNPLAAVCNVSDYARYVHAKSLYP